MTTPFHSSRDAGAVLGTWSGSERLAIESALTDAHLERRQVRRAAGSLRALLSRVLRAVTTGRALEDRPA